MFEGFKQHQINVGEVEIACVVAGEGEPVLMLHGFPQTMAVWARIAPALVAQGHQVVCADLRGYGASSKPTALASLANYGFRAMALDQLALMRALGHARFHVVGHDRGARVAHRLALDHPDSVASVALMDIVPTMVLLTDLRKEVAHSYWHWFFLSQPAPFPERMIEADPDFFFESCLFGWGAAGPEDFNAEQLLAYRESWRDPATIAGYCNDYRAALAVDFADDSIGQGRRIAVPAQILYGASGAMARHYDIPATWSERFTTLASEAIPGGHFFPDSAPDEVAKRLDRFIAQHPLHDIQRQG
ncbi:MULTISPECIES: alpha/beta fold hydrolase [Pseudomonas]|uniref:Alpha/beta hydrolase n=1 Tax=Pseudomonas petroselini TaxID=2899822 RepID=A0ABS8R3V7_9PSED|nr:MULTISPECIES: alpha/beta hydrolase [Pseudomonas]MCD7042558.1 alpha/beta hydrolase [Pseudomonas petroselini]MCD7048808.1 alpha/beta hydrolase [Pseudomonas petroselini]MCD7067630.1 alpha/beta hydrolase [Pseudomonas petroselini]MCD7082447.1 alpha/beta hydrolase [Pseudomonas petroselini]MCM2379660.1 alpha/beta hydrolase [Pseudomonas marginalis]